MERADILRTLFVPISMDIDGAESIRIPTCWVKSAVREFITVYYDLN